MPNKRWVVRSVVGLSLGVALFWSTPRAFAKGKESSASAKESSASAKEKKKVLVGAFAGSKSGSARDAVIAALKDAGAYDVSESSDLKADGDDQSYAKGSAGAAAVIVGTVSDSGLVLSVRNGADGTLVQDINIKGSSAAKLNKNIARQLSSSVAGVIARTKSGGAGEQASTDSKEGGAESEEAAPKQDESAGEDTSASAHEPASAGASPLELTAGLRAVHRRFAYHDTPDQLFPNRPGLLKAPGYTLPLGPAAFIDATLYPLAFGSRGPGAMFGITGGYEQNFATKSVYGTPERTLTTQASQFYAGLKVRVPISAHEIGLLAAYGQQTFKLTGDEANPQVPDVAYKFIRLGAEVRLRFEAFSLAAHAGTRLVGSTGGLEHDWFPNRTKTQSLEAGVSAGYALGSGFEALFGFDLMRYAFNFNPNPPTANPYTQVIAGGAVDQYTSGWLALRYSVPNHAP